MAVTAVAGFEIATAGADGDVSTFTGTANYSTVQARTGARSVRCNPASGATGNFTIAAAVTNSRIHFGLYIATLPSVARVIAGTTGSGQINLLLNTDGTLAVRNNVTTVGTSTTALATGAWYWIALELNNGVTGVLLRINDTDQISGTNGTTFGATLGCTGTEASAIDIYFDDLIVDSANYLNSSKVYLLTPISDNAVGTGWTNDAAGTTNLWDAVNNTPPVGIADTTGSTGLHQIRNATNNASVNYDANLTTYTTAGVNPGDTILAVDPRCSTGAPVSTGAKQGTFGVVSNPTIANVALAAGGTSGAFWSGTAAGTFATGWKLSSGTFTTSPSVTLGTSPVLRITQVTGSTRIAMLCFMAMYVAWTPGARTPRNPGVNFQNPGVL